jgi:hypothetical protein
MTDAGMFSPRNAVGLQGDWVLGAPLAIGDMMAPAVVPVAPLAITQDASAWPAVAAGQSTAITVAYGVLAPDGTSTAATIGSSSGAITFVLGSFAITPAVGDWVIIGCYLWNPNARRRQRGKWRAVPSGMVEHGRVVRRLPRCGSGRHIEHRSWQSAEFQRCPELLGEQFLGAAL